MRLCSIIIYSLVAFLSCTNGSDKSKKETLGPSPPSTKKFGNDFLTDDSLIVIGRTFDTLAEFLPYLNLLTSEIELIKLDSNKYNEVYKAKKGWHAAWTIGWLQYFIARKERRLQQVASEEKVTQKQLQNLIALAKGFGYAGGAVVSYAKFFKYIRLLEPEETAAILKDFGIKDIKSRKWSGDFDRFKRSRGFGKVRAAGRLIVGAVIVKSIIEAFFRNDEEKLKKLDLTGYTIVIND